jgi:PD-(D/E)XK nuclease superfamily
MRDAGPIRVGATDVGSNSECGLFLALKVRPRAKVVDGWIRLWPHENSPFPLADVIEIVMAAHTMAPKDDHQKAMEWIASRITARGVHRLLREFVQHAVENLLEAHESIEEDIGPLRCIAWQPEVGPADRKLWAWAPLYQSENGTREIRRVRLGSAHTNAEEGDVRWAATAAYVAANFSSLQPATRVRVVEIGLVDGSVTVLFDDTPNAASNYFAENGRDTAARLVTDDHTSPCSSCGSCKTAGSCHALVAVDGVLGQTSRGYESRSVSPSELQRYAVCPAQWLFASSVHLPREIEGSDAASRGIAVHRWLEAAHKRGRMCQLEDVPDPSERIEADFAVELLDDEEYATARPFLLAHLDVCPLRPSDVDDVEVEVNLYSYDHLAEVVVVSRPDIVYRIGHRLVVREVKTAATSYPGGRDDAYDKHLQIPFLLAMLASGLANDRGCTSSSVELELLTPDGSQIWSWDTADAAVLAVARGDVRRAVEDWHTDATWDPKPGPHCAWCPVSRWCPERDTWQNRNVGAAGGPAGSSEEEPAPF